MKKLLRLMVLFCWFFLMTEQVVFAYLDPGTGSLFLQLLLGGVAGLAVIAKLYWRRLLSFLGVTRQDNSIDGGRKDPEVKTYFYHLARIMHKSLKKGPI